MAALEEVAQLRAAVNPQLMVAFVLNQLSTLNTCRTSTLTLGVPLSSLLSKHY
jgi:hypothetical protein